ncbi:MAG TPA: cytochrome c3 family protein [Terriglobia bacterium]|nr:cytochrome c3 family protein [Terriglobia bacterium]
MLSLRGWTALGLGFVITGAIATFVSCSSGKQTEVKHPSYVTSGQFTTAHPTLLAAAKDYIDSYPTHVRQPIAFTHKVHLQHGMQCTDCHKGVADGPNATIPNVQLCMTCHQVIATNKPEIKKVAAYQKKGEQIPWHRVYWFYQSAHVKFRHGPHIRAGVKCATCHGDMKQQTVAVRKAGLDMGFCVGCHRMHKAPTDCTTCHF